MLQHLEINNFAIIEHVSIDFDEGMTVLTGETGAGKSIIIDAIGQLMGGRGSTDFIRYGSDKLVIKGIFFMPHLSEVGRDLLESNQIPFDDQQLLITRELNQAGKNTIKVNGVALTVSLLKVLGQYMVDIHGQNEHQALMQTQNHLPLLDQFGWETYGEDYAAYQTAFARYEETRQALESVQMNEQETAQRIDLLRYQIDEIAQSQVDPGEEETLKQERDQMRNYQKLVAALQNSNTQLADQEWNIVDLLGNVVGELDRIADVDDTYAAYAEKANSAFFIVQDLVSDLRAASDSLYYDANRLDEVEARLQLYTNLHRKYGETSADILAYLESAQSELDHFENLESYQVDTLANFKAAKKAVLQQGEKLHRLRMEVAMRLEKRIKAELRELYMEKAQFQVKIEQTDQISKTGIDQVAFYIAANVGEPLKPLAKTASGGELSRIMLAMKTVFQASQNVTAIIFDEVDTGVSGRVAQAIANKMYQIGMGAQVLCISHLPQVAAMADHHLHIQKRAVADRTLTEVTVLTPEARITEVAQMTTGEEVTETSWQAAKEQLAHSERYKQQLADTKE